jgi:hypothetical protein
MGCRRLWHRKGLPWPRPALIFSRTLLDALADLRTATPIYFAALKVVEELQLTDHPTARKFDTKADGPFRRSPYKRFATPDYISRKLSSPGC